MSQMQCFIIDTNAGGQNTRKIKSQTVNDDTYAVKLILFGDVSRIVSRLYMCCPVQPNTELVQFNLVCKGVTKIAHHQYNNIYAAACEIGPTSFEVIFSKLHSLWAKSNMTQTSVNQSEQ